MAAELLSMDRPTKRRVRIHVVCFRCGTAVEIGQRFCHNCGMQNPTVERKWCRTCRDWLNRRTEGTMFYCPVCGSPIVYEKGYVEYEMSTESDRIKWYLINWSLSQETAELLVRWQISPGHALIATAAELAGIEGFTPENIAEIKAKRKV